MPETAVSADPFADITVTTGADGTTVKPVETPKEPAKEVPPIDLDKPAETPVPPENTPPVDDTKSANPPKDPAPDKTGEPVNAEFEKLKTDHSALSQRCVALERELAFYKQQEQEITSDPKAWIQQNAPSLLEAPLDIDKELEKEFGSEFLANEYEMNAKAGTKSFKYDMRRYQLFEQQQKAAQGGELSGSIAKNKAAMTEGIAAIDSIVTELQTKFKLDDNYLREKVKVIDDFCKGNPYKASAIAMRAMIESENLTLERAKELVAKDELLKKDREKAKPTPSGKQVVTPSQVADEKDDSGFGDLDIGYKKFGVR